MRNITGESCRENQNTHFVFSNFFSENLAVYETMSKNLVQPERPQRVWRLRFAYWINKATPLHPYPHIHTDARTSMRSPKRAHTHTEICNTYCNLHTSTLRYTYIASLLITATAHKSRKLFGRKRSSNVLKMHFHKKSLGIRKQNKCD
jgi:hypothetical protein